MNDESTKGPVVKSLVRKAFETIATIKESIRELNSPKDRFVNQPRPHFRPSLVPIIRPRIEHIRFERDNQRKRRENNRRQNPNGFTYRHL